MAVEELKVGPVRLLHESHLHGGTILKHDFAEEYQDLLDVLTNFHLPLRDATAFSDRGRPLKPKRQKRKFDGVERPALLPADLPTLNKDLDKILKSKGWDSQPIASTSGLLDKESKLGLKGDFVRNRVFVEVEFGNIASMHRDLFKFQIANRAAIGDIGVLITATDRLARFHDQGVTTFEGAQRIRPYLAVGIQMPIWIVGLEPYDWSPLRERYDDMWKTCMDHGVECHRFEVVHGTDEPIADVIEDPTALPTSEEPEEES